MTSWKKAGVGRLYIFNSNSEHR